ncbi:DMT family transporter [Marivivens donghaensis]|uniref:DMT family transporter n=1 Tax=Marivivens donghaensis TaxID=1699413 RepID=A0ABX0VYQ1_9RHOB|nr:DMT family transporter [Marivivens donghaensis]NIY72915.1 DMT family transporter [Marivivens donghaensis]
MSSTLRAALWMIGAITAFSSMAVAGRQMSGHLDTFEIMFYRSLVGILIMVTVVLVTGKRGDIKTDRLPLHFIRNISHFTGQNLWFFAVGLIPLAQVFAMEFTAPIWVIILSPLILKEKLRPIGVVSGILGFIGILVVTRPSPETLEWPLIAAGLAAIGFAFSAIFTRKLTRDQSTVCILFWLSIMQAVFGLICAGYDLNIHVPDMATVPYVVLVGCAGLFAHFCLTTALSLAPASIVMPIDFARLPLIAVVGMVLFGEAIDVYVLIGAAIIFFANWINIRSSQN